MFRGKLWKKLMITYLLIIMVLFLLINYPIKAWVRNKQENKVISQMRGAAESCINLYLNGNNREITDILSTSEIFTGYNFWLVSEDGTVTVDAFGGNAGINILRYYESFLDKKEIRNSNLNGFLLNNYMI